MSLKQSRVLYIERSAFTGGSVISLYELVRGLDKSLYEPIVLFYEPHPYREKYRALGVKIITLRGQTSAAKLKPPDRAQPDMATKPQRDTAASLSRYSNRLATGYRTMKDAYLLARYDWPMARLIARLIKSEAIALVHHNTHLCGNRDTIMAAWLAGVPQVCHVRTLCGFSSFERYLARSVDAFIYISKAVEDRYRSLGIPANKGQVVYNPVDVDAFGHANHAAELRAEFGLADQDRLISNVGRLEWWKGQDCFVQAMAEVIQSQPNVKALIVGEPEFSRRSQAHYQRVQQLVRDLQLSDRVILTGFRSDIPRIMAASDIVVHSASEPEPFGRVIVEAMAAGRPVVATAAGGVPDIIEDQVTGLLVPPKNATLMAKAIQQFLQNEEQATIVGQRAQRYVKERFSVGQHVAAVQHIYQKTLASSGQT